MTARSAEEAGALLRAERLTKLYTVGSRKTEVLGGVSFEVGAGETVGLIGGSGAGKSTVGRIVGGLEKPSGGTLAFEGRLLSSLRGSERRIAAAGIQMVFQDPYESLSPRMKVRELVAEPLLIRKSGGTPDERTERVREALEEVALSAERYMDRYPHELSGGERQRVGLARAFVSRPRLIVADEPTSMLDTSLRLELVRTMKRLQERHRVAYLFITHDIALAQGFCDRLLVLNEGRIVESGSVSELVNDARHPYTQKLIGGLMELESSDHYQVRKEQK